MSPDPLMSAEERRRRAIATGLTPYLDPTQVVEAVALWQRDYQGRPRFSLQGFVSELSRLFDLAGRRHDVHLSLVQAMSLPDRSLGADPLKGQVARRAHPSTLALQCLFRALWAQMSAIEADQFRLDQFTDLRRQRLDEAVRDQVEFWLNHTGEDLPPLDRHTLRHLLNRGYVLLCERFGPVIADRVLKAAVERVRASHPELTEALHSLL